MVVDVYELIKYGSTAYTAYRGVRWASIRFGLRLPGVVRSAGSIAVAVYAEIVTVILGIREQNKRLED